MSGGLELESPKCHLAFEFAASVGMLAKEAERFRSREDRDGGSSGAPEPSSQRKRPRRCAPVSPDEREHREATSGGGWGRRRHTQRALVTATRFAIWVHELGCSVELATRDRRRGQARRNRACLVGLRM